MNKNIECILFDLDGTFADTSKDMCDALNTILTEKKFTNVNCKELKLHISRGAVGIIDYASKVNGRSIDSSLMRAEFLQEYSNNTFVHTKMVDGIAELIKNIEKNHIKWGIVTNKHSKYVNKILKGFSINEDVKYLITGDMLEETKPSPEGLLKAIEMADVNAENTIYVGDDERDIIAGKNAGMFTVAADFGFIGPDKDIHSWNADVNINKPLDLIKILSL